MHVVELDHVLSGEELRSASEGLDMSVCVIAKQGCFSCCCLGVSSLLMMLSMFTIVATAFVTVRVI